MFRRAKISALLPLVGVIAATAAPLDPGQKNPVFQPGAGAALTARAPVLKPAATPVWARSPQWSGVKVSKITLAPQQPAPAEVSGVTFRKTSEAAAPQATVQPAGGSR